MKHNISSFGEIAVTDYLKNSHFKVEKIYNLHNKKNKSYIKDVSYSMLLAFKNDNDIDDYIVTVNMTSFKINYNYFIEKIDATFSQSDWSQVLEQFSTPGKNLLNTDKSTKLFGIIQNYNYKIEKNSINDLLDHFSEKQHQFPNIYNFLLDCKSGKTPNFNKNCQNELSINPNDIDFWDKVEHLRFFNSLKWITLYSYVPDVYSEEKVINGETLYEKKDVLHAILENWQFKLMDYNNTNDPFEFLVDNQKQNNSVEWSVRCLCLSRTPNSSSMWGHYANSHRGYLLVYKLPIVKIGDDINLAFSNSDIVDVNYDTERYKDILLSKNFSEKYCNYPHMLGVLTRKSSEWEFEQEVRIIIRFDHKIIPDYTSDILPYLHGIVCGIKNTNRDNVKLMISKLCSQGRSELNKVKVYKAELPKTGFCPCIIDPDNSETEIDFKNCNPIASFYS